MTFAEKPDNHGIKHDNKSITGTFSPEIPIAWRAGDRAPACILIAGAR
jgi:hypothetical protein